MIPGLALFYSGLLRRKNALSQLWLGMIGIGVTSFQVSQFQNIIKFSRDSKLTRLIASTVVLVGLLLDFLRQCRSLHR